MTPILGHQRRCHKTEARHHKGYHRQLEDQSRSEQHVDDETKVASNIDVILYSTRLTSKREIIDVRRHARNKQEITKCNTCDEAQRRQNRNAPYPPALRDVESRGDKTPQLVQHPGEGKDQTTQDYHLEEQECLPKRFSVDQRKAAGRLEQHIFDDLVAEVAYNTAGNHNTNSCPE